MIIISSLCVMCCFTGSMAKTAAARVAAWRRPGHLHATCARQAERWRSWILGGGGCSRWGEQWTAGTGGATSRTLAVEVQINIASDYTWFPQHPLLRKVEERRGGRILKGGFPKLPPPPWDWEYMYIEMCVYVYIYIYISYMYSPPHPPPPPPAPGGAEVPRAHVTCY